MRKHKCRDCGKVFSGKPLVKIGGRIAPKWQCDSCYKKGSKDGSSTKDINTNTDND